MFPLDFQNPEIWIISFGDVIEKNRKIEIAHKYIHLLVHNSDISYRSSLHKNQNLDNSHSSVRSNSLASPKETRLDFRHAPISYVVLKFIFRLDNVQ